MRTGVSARDAAVEHDHGVAGSAGRTWGVFKGSGSSVYVVVVMVGRPIRGCPSAFLRQGDAGLSKFRRLGGKEIVD